MNRELPQKKSNLFYKKIKISLCIPTFNRGKLALKNVKKILNHLESNWELIVLNNSSDKETDYYNEIENLSKTNKSLKYFYKNLNSQFVGNFIDCFNYSSGNYIFILSDEDSFEFKNFSKIIKFLDQNPDVAALRPSVGKQKNKKRANSFSREDKIFEAGYDAIVNFSIWNSYISGMIYNREKVLEQGFINRLEKNKLKFRHYPHIYLDMLISAKCKVAQTSTVTIIEGSPQIVENNGLPQNDDDSVNYNGPYTLGSRMDQFIVERDGLFEATSLVSEEFNNDIFFNAYLQLCVRFIRNILISNMKMYESNKINITFLNETINQYVISSIRDFDNYECYSRVFTSEIRRISNLFKKMYIEQLR